MHEPRKDINEAAWALTCHVPAPLYAAPVWLALALALAMPGHRHLWLALALAAAALLGMAAPLTRPRRGGQGRRSVLLVLPALLMPASLLLPLPLAALALSMLRLALPLGECLASPRRPCAPSALAGFPALDAALLLATALALAGL